MGLWGGSLSTRRVFSVVRELFGRECAGVRTVALVRSGSGSESGARNASTETSGASLPRKYVEGVSLHTHAAVQVLTVEMRRVDVKAYDRARRSKADDAPYRHCHLCPKTTQTLDMDIDVPIERWIVSPRLPSAIQRAVGSELTFETRCGLGGRSGFNTSNSDG